MKNIILILFCIIIHQGCKKDSLCNCIENTGSDKTEIRQLEAFNAIELNNNVDVILTPDSSYFAEVTSGKNLMDGIETKVIGDRLVIRNKNRCNWLRDFENKFIVNIHYKSIRQITNNGSGNLSCADTLRENYLMVENWNGTGELNFKINGKETYLKIHTGPADIIASGKSELLYIYSAGNGYVRSANLVANYINVTNKSTGDCEIFPLYEMDVKIGYSGDVYYKGNPTVIKQDITGTGTLAPL